MIALLLQATAILASSAIMIAVLPLQAVSILMVAWVLLSVQATLILMVGPSTITIAVLPLWATSILMVALVLFLQATSILMVALLLRGPAIAVFLIWATSIEVVPVVLPNWGTTFVIHMPSSSSSSRPLGIATLQIWVLVVSSLVTIVTIVSKLIAIIVPNCLHPYHQSVEILLV